MTESKLQTLQHARTMARDGATDCEIAAKFPELVSRLASIRENLFEDVTLEIMGTKRFDSQLSKAQNIELLRKLKK